MEIGFFNKHNLRSRIIELLGERPASALKLHEFLQLKYRKCSYQAVYKELDKLRKAGLILKAGRHWALSVSWLLNALSGVEQLYQRCLSGYLAESVAAGPKPAAWRFSTLPRLDDFWIEATLAMYHLARAKKLYAWIPQPWFVLLHFEQDLRFQSALRRMRGKFLSIMGGDTYLYKYCTRSWPSDLYTVSYAAPDFALRRNESVMVCGDLILKVGLDAASTALLDRLFSRARKKEDVTPAIVNELTRRRISGRVSLIADQSKAERYLRKFRDYFGS